MHNLLRSLSFLLVFVSSFSAFGQQSIDQQFEEFYENSTTTWQEYRLVKKPRLKDFWKVVSDTVSDKRNQIAASKVEIVSLNQKLNKVKTQLTETQSSLDKSNLLNGSITFVGVEFVKTTYNVMVWLIVLGLALAVIFIYFMYMRSNSVTNESRLTLESVENEFKDYKDKSRDAQIKLKRELQTALNTIHENRLKH
ncbi:MAG: hypothetical protein OCD76_02870 [Reichenbachiella sp.]